jgi:indolepyruvate ferredoxin oxidoreductase alpha subunit
VDQQLLSGNEAVALAARDAGIALGAGYPGTPSTEILETLGALGGHARWAPNEKVALEVALGAAYGAARALVTMKHVGLNVAADPLFTAAYTGVSGALVLVCADDPGMASSQNEQDSRRYAIAAGVPMLSPADAQEAYDFLFQAVEISERWKLPVLFRMTTRVCHSKSLVRPHAAAASPRPPFFERDIPGRVMVPGFARPAHRRLRAKLDELAAFADTTDLNAVIDGDPALGIVAEGVSYLHAAEASPASTFFKLGLVHPLPLERLRAFAKRVQRCVVVEEGDPVIADALRAAGIAIESRPDMYRFGELDVVRVRRILARDVSPEPPLPKGKPPELCPACPYHPVYATLRKLDCIVAGDIGCYTLGVMEPYRAMDTCVAMGASIGVGLGLRHVLPPEQARRVVSIIGDSTFIHSGVSGVMEMVYNPPPLGHVVLVLDNGITAMTGQQEHPGTGRSLEHGPAGQVSIEGVCRAMGVETVVTDAFADPAGFEKLLVEKLATPRPCVIVSRRACVLAAADIRRWDQQNAARVQACTGCAEGDG